MLQQLWASGSFRGCSSAALLCRLQSLQTDIQTAEHNEDHHLQVLKESETLLQAKRAELETLKSQVWLDPRKRLFKMYFFLRVAG